MSLEQEAGGVHGGVGVDKANELELDPGVVTDEPDAVGEIGAKYLEFFTFEAHQDLRGSQRDRVRCLLGGEPDAGDEREMVRVVRAAATADMEYP